jgi:hypothetical protein
LAAKAPRGFGEVALAERHTLSRGFERKHALQIGL